MIPELLPWHDGQWNRVGRSVRSGRMPHALLLHGVAGTGKGLFAGRLAARLMCRSEGSPCEACDSCRFCAAGTHPDLTYVTIEKDRREIVVEQIRNLVHAAELTARIGRCKVAVVDPAEQMNRHAANTLLKTLEEPPGDTVFLLVSSNHSLLLATIRSRCQMIAFPCADREQAIGWLRDRVPDAESALDLANGAPVRAAALSGEGLGEIRSGLERDLDTLLTGGEPVAVASHWRSLGRATVSLWLTDILGQRLRDGAIGRTGTRTPADRIGISRLLAALDVCLDVRRGVLMRSSTNELLALERLALAISRAGLRVERKGSSRQTGS